MAWCNHFACSNFAKYTLISTVTGGVVNHACEAHLGCFLGELLDAADATKSMQSITILTQEQGPKQ